MASYRIHQSLVTKPVPINDFWPLWGDKHKDTNEQIVMTRDIYKDIKKAYKLK